MGSWRRSLNHTVSRRGFSGRGGVVSQGSLTVAPSRALSPTTSLLSSPAPAPTSSITSVTDISVSNIITICLAILEHCERMPLFKVYIYVSVIKNCWCQCRMLLLLSQPILYMKAFYQTTRPLICATYMSFVLAAILSFKCPISIQLFSQLLGTAVTTDNWHKCWWWFDTKYSIQKYNP